MKKQLINLEPVKEQVKQKLLEKYDASVFMNTTKVELKVDVMDILDEYIEQQQIIEPTICITTKAYIKMRLLVDKFDKEIGWYGIVNQMPGLPNTYVIEDIVVYPQKVTGATCEQDEDRMFEFEMRLTTDQVNHKRFHGHSHVNMGTGPSSVDENFYQDILSQVNDYFIITVTNKKNEYTTRFYDVQNNILYTDLDIHLIDEEGNPMSTWYDEQIENNILDSIKEYLHLIHLVLVMTVEPGEGGQEFIEESEDRINEIRDLINSYNLNIVISVDGGINDITRRKCNTDIVVAGSYIIKGDNFQDKISSLR